MRFFSNRSAVAVMDTEQGKAYLVFNLRGNLPPTLPPSKMFSRKDQTQIFNAWGKTKHDPQ